MEGFTVSAFIGRSTVRMGKEIIKKHAYLTALKNGIFKLWSGIAAGKVCNCV